MIKSEIKQNVTNFGIHINLQLKLGKTIKAYTKQVLHITQTKLNKQYKQANAKEKSGLKTTNLIESVTILQHTDTKSSVISTETSQLRESTVRTTSVAI